MAELTNAVLSMEDVLGTAREIVAAVPVPIVHNEPVAVRTSIKQDEMDVIRITCTHPVPTIKNVVPHLDADHRKKVKIYEYNNVERHIKDTISVIPFQLWADAISAAIMTTLANKEGATSEMRGLVQGGYLAIGDVLYKMSAVAQLPQTKALAMAKRKIREVAELEGKSIKEATQAACDAMLANALHTRQHADHYKAQIMQEVGSLPPKWIVDLRYPIKFVNGLWSVQVTINFWISHFDIGISGGKRFSFDADPGPTEKVRLWIPLQNDGKFAATSICVDQHDKRMPHIKHNGACMGLSSGPTYIKRPADLSLLIEALEHCHSRVQLDSLYVPYDELLISWKPFFPKVLVDAYVAYGDIGPQRVAQKMDDELKKAKELASQKAKELRVAVTTEEEETRTTWTAAVL